MAWKEPPSGLSPAARDVWRSLRKESQIYHSDFHAHVPDTVVDTSFGPRGRRATPRMKVLPNPGGLTWLGTLLEVHWASPDGRIGVTGWKPGVAPELYWSEKLQACLSFPGRALPPARYSPSRAPKLLKTYRRWHGGKDPQNGVSSLRIPKARFTSFAPAIAVVYRSDKFGKDGEYTDYIHHHDPGVWVSFARDAIMIRGGSLELTRHGLIK